MSLQNSNTARFVTAALISLFVTVTTLVPIFPRVAFAFSVPIPHPQAYERPPTSGYYPEPEPCHGSCSGIHDPDIVYAEGTYWRFSTGGNIAIASAPSLSGPWKYLGALLHNGTKIFLRKDQDIWVSWFSNQYPYATLIHIVTNFNHP